MLFYVALAWNGQNPLTQQAASTLLQRFQERTPGWSIVLKVPGLAVSCRIPAACSRVSEVYRLHGAAGVVLGKLFKRNQEAGAVPAPVVLGEQESANIVASGGRRLTQHYWGAYVAFLKDDEAHTVWVLRDPTGGIGCYMTRVGDVDVYFLRLEDCERLDAPQMTVNRRGLIASTVFAMTAYRVTALNQVSVLLAGECMELQQDRHTLKRYWNPLEVAQTDLIEDQQEAERLTRATVSTCVHAWASCFDTILHRLSGGLDSTIVLACLKDAPNRPYVVCENYYGSAGSQFDERAFARLTARHAGFELIETPLRGEDYFEIRQTLRSSPDPYPCEPMEGDMRRIAELMRARSVPGMFHGHGGDELFFRFGKFPTVADFLYSHRLFLKAARIAFDDSAVIKAPLWRIARSAVIWGLLRRRWNYRDDYRRDLRKYPALVDEIVPEHVWNEVFGDDSVWHPLYLHDIANLPPGKAYQCYLISMAAEARSAPPPDEPDLPIKISPLLSQPFIELSLRTPLYVLRAGGRDRAIARRAFRDQIPAAILERRSKGGGNDLLQSALRRNIASVRQRLVNGRLVQLGYLDGRKLADVLALDSPTRLKVYPAAIWRHFMNEVWLERWPSDALAAAC